jgi:hypothetical protein
MLLPAESTKVAVTKTMVSLSPFLSFMCAFTDMFGHNRFTLLI